MRFNESNVNAVAAHVVKSGFDRRDARETYCSWVLMSNIERKGSYRAFTRAVAEYAPPGHWAFEGTEEW
jgi:hypothetical protein